jgi:hypothetical protein
MSKDRHSTEDGIEVVLRVEGLDGQWCLGRVPLSETLTVLTVLKSQDIDAGQLPGISGDIGLEKLTGKLELQPGMHAGHGAPVFYVVTLVPGRILEAKDYG